MTKLTKKQESLLNELLEDFKGAPEAVLGQHGLMNEYSKSGSPFGHAMMSDETGRGQIAREA